jgi:hypothetical protein
MHRDGAPERVRTGGYGKEVVGKRREGKLRI